MNVVGITQNGNDFCYAVLKRHDKLDPTFKAAIKKLDSWDSIDDEELLDAQTFVSWYQDSHPKASIEDSLENESFAWQGLAMESQEEGEWGVWEEGDEE